MALGNKDQAHPTPRPWSVMDEGYPPYVLIYDANGERVCRMIDEPKIKNAQLIVDAVNALHEMENKE